MKKLINILSLPVLALAMAFTFSIASAQVTGGSGCVVINGTQYCGGVNGQGGQGQNPNNLPPCSSVPAGTTCSNVPNNQGGGTYNPGIQAQANQSDLSFFGHFIAEAGGIIRLLPPILIGLAVVVFFFYLIRYLIGGKDPAEKKKHLNGMMYSLLAIFVMVAIWGIIYFVASALGINLSGSIPAPTLPY